MLYLAAAILIFVFPFGVLGFAHDRVFSGISITILTLASVIDAVAIALKRQPPIPFGLLLVPAIVAIAMALVANALYGALWCYPGVLLCYLVLPRRWAIVGSLAMLGVAAPMVVTALGQDVALRFVVSLALTIVVIYIINDVIRELQTELLAQAITDPLTGAYNRRQMEFSLDEAIERYQRSGVPASALMIDIDFFKRINDDLGHGVGDRVLKSLVLLIKNRARKLDRLFRMGGEEFLLLLPDTPATAAMIQAENLRQRIAEGNLIKNRQVTVSIGVADLQRDLKQDEWIKIADTALYQAKSSGRNRVVRGEVADSTAAAPPSDIDADERRARQRHE